MNFTHLQPRGPYMAEKEFHDHWNANSSTTFWQKFKIIFKRGLEIKIRIREYMVGWGLSTLDATKSTKTLGSTTLPSDLCRCFSLAEIKAAGNNFDNVFIIAVGRFGNVYEGYIDGWAEGNSIAIKRLKPGSQQGAHEFETEIEMSPQLLSYWVL